MSDDRDLENIDVGDLPAALERIANEEAAAASRADDDLPVRQVHEGFCVHERATIDDGLRRVTCRKCGAVLDPFDVLLKLTRTAERFIAARKDAEARARQAETRLQEILRLERNARARLKRTERKPKP